MATRIVPSLPENVPSAFEHRSEHGRYLLSDRDYIDERISVVSALSEAQRANAATSNSLSAFTTPAQTISVYEANTQKEIDGTDIHAEDETDLAFESAGDKATVDGYLGLFPHRNESAIRYSDFAEWRDVSRFHFLTDDEILGTLRLDSKLKRAIRFETRTRMQVLHVPCESPYLTIPSATLLKQEFKKSGITVKHYQYNNDWYFYLFVDEFIDASLLQKPVANLLESAGFSISSTTLAICTASTPVPLPVQPGFAWINDRGQISVRRDEISLQGALALFVSDVKRFAIPADTLSLLLCRNESAAPESIKAATTIKKASESVEKQDVGLTTISLLESVGLNVGDEDRISCFSVFDTPESQCEVAAPSDFARKIANCNSGTKSAPVGMHKTSRSMEAMTIRKRMAAKLEPGSDATDADYLQKLNQALRHP